MYRKFVTLLLVIFCVGSIAASAQTKKTTRVNKQPYVGCWSGGNTPPSVYQFTRTTIKSSVTRKNVFRYKEVFRDEENKTYLLELREKDKQNYFQKFLAIRFVGEESVELKDYETMEAFKRGEESGKLNVFLEDDCKSMSSFFR